MEEFTEKLLQGYENGSFLDVVYELDIESRENENSLGSLLTQMHNNGQLDVIAEFRKLKKTG